MVQFNNAYLSGVESWLNWEKLSPMLRHGSVVEKKRVNMLASPIATLLRQAGASRVDLLSLDVEGSERAILETLDFHVIGVLLIERGKSFGIPTYLREHGVEYVGNILWDAVFVTRQYRESALKESDESPSTLAALSQRLAAELSRPFIKKKLCRCMAQVKTKTLSKESARDCRSYCVLGEGVAE